MIAKPELVGKIKDYFDLNIYETKVWLALLSKGIVSAGETAEISGVPRSRTYDVLEGLEKKGFAIVKLGKPVKYIAVEPNTIIEKMKSHLLSEAQDRIKSLASLRETQEYTELEQLHKSGMGPIKPEDISGFIKGKSNINSKLRELLANAQKEITICTTLNDFERKSKIILPFLESAKNVKVKVVLSGDQNEVRKAIAKSNIKARYGDHKGRFFMIDKSEVLFMINPEQAEEEIAIWLKSPFFTESIDAMMDYQLKKQA